ncbi:MAG: TRAP transporter permease, partial [Clostridia bacterium]|nr:TRAP transporter permease [Clostridia bacterium]
MFWGKRKNPVTTQTMDLQDVMQKFDRESNTRIWEGKAKNAVNCILALFSLFCIYVTLFTSWLEEIRLTSFVAFIIFIGYLMYPARKG